MIPVVELAEWVGAEEADYATLAGLEEAAVAQIEGATGRYFGPLESVTEVVAGTGLRGRLYLADLPTLAEGGEEIVVAVQYAAIGEALADDTALTLRTRGNEAWLERTDGGRWDDSYEYHVTYTRGYAEGAEPADIRDAVMQIVAEHWTRRGKEGFQSEQIGGYAYTMTSRITDRGTIAQVIQRWRRPVFA